MTPLPGLRISPRNKARPKDCSQSQRNDWRKSRIGSSKPKAWIQAQVNLQRRSLLLCSRLEIWKNSERVNANRMTRLPGWKVLPRNKEPRRGCLPNPKNGSKKNLSGCGRRKAWAIGLMKFLRQEFRRRKRRKFLLYRNPLPALKNWGRAKQNGTMPLPGSRASPLNRVPPKDC